METTDKACEEFRFTTGSHRRGVSAKISDAQNKAAPSSSSHFADERRNFTGGEERQRGLDPRERIVICLLTF